MAPFRSSQNHSLNFEQRREVESIFRRYFPHTYFKHLIDVRFKFTLLSEWYFVFLFGKDVYKPLRSEKKVQSLLENLISLLFYLVIIILFFLGTGFMLYLLKSYLGIDIFPDYHLIDIIHRIFR